MNRAPLALSLSTWASVEAQTHDKDGQNERCHTQILLRISNYELFNRNAAFLTRCRLDVCSSTEYFFEVHLHVRFVFKWVVSSFLSRSRMRGGEGGGGGGAAGAWWAPVSCSDCRVLWELLSGNTSSRHRTARLAMWVIHWYTCRRRDTCKSILSIMWRLSIMDDLFWKFGMNRLSPAYWLGSFKAYNK